MAVAGVDRGLFIKTICCKTICPLVIVPVLSKTTSVIPTAFSIDRGDLITMPDFAALPEATSSAIGVAKPSAHGQAMTSTETAAVIERVISVPVRYLCSC